MRHADVRECDLGRAPSEGDGRPAAYLATPQQAAVAHEPAPFTRRSSGSDRTFAGWGRALAFPPESDRGPGAFVAGYGNSGRVIAQSRDDTEPLDGWCAAEPVEANVCGDEQQGVEAE